MASHGVIGCGTAEHRQIAGKQPRDIAGQLSPHSRACSSMGRSFRLDRKNSPQTFDEL
jgi:hypothetical protein